MNVRRWAHLGRLPSSSATVNVPLVSSPTTLNVNRSVSSQNDFPSPLPRCTLPAVNGSDTVSLLASMLVRTWRIRRPARPETSQNIAPDASATTIHPPAVVGDGLADHRDPRARFYVADWQGRMRARALCHGPLGASILHSSCAEDPTRSSARMYLLPLHRLIATSAAGREPAPRAYDHPAQIRTPPLRQYFKR